jgi:hypothetical protein
MVQVVHYYLWRVLYINNKIEMDGVFISCNLWTTLPIHVIYYKAHFKL